MLTRDYDREGSTVQGVYDSAETAMRFGDGERNMRDTQPWKRVRTTCWQTADLTVTRWTLNERPTR